MPMPRDIGIIDLMLGIPSPDPKRSYDFMKPLFRDAESRKSFEFPVEYMIDYANTRGAALRVFAL